MKAGGTPDWAQVSGNLRALVTKKGPVRLGDLSSQYHALHGRALDLGGKRVKACIAEGKMQGLQRDAKKKLLKLDGSSRGTKRPPAPSGHRIKPAPAKEAKTWQTSPTTSAVPPSMPLSCSRASNGKSSKDSRFPSSPYLLIDSNQSCLRALATLSGNGPLGATLQQLNNGVRVAMQLDGISLGSEAGQISYVKVRYSRFRTTAAVFCNTEREKKTGCQECSILAALGPLPIPPHLKSLHSCAYTETMKLDDRSYIDR